MVYNNFSDGYKEILIKAENKIKGIGFKELREEDIFLEIVNSASGAIEELFSVFGINTKLIIELFENPPFNKELKSRKGVYSGLSKELKDSILNSVKIAASFSKEKASTEDFLLTLIRKKTWFYEILNYIGINPADVETNIVEMNKFGIVDGGGKEKTASSMTIQEGFEKLIGTLAQNIYSAIPHDDEDELETPFDKNPDSSKKAKKDSNTPALDFFSLNLTEEAKNGKIDPVIGRENEIERLISILNRKTKNNPILVGEPGVGKTAIIEGLALKIAAGDVPVSMRDKKILALDMTMIIAGTKYRGEFETRIKQIIDEASKVENEIILFIDEIHTIIGAGGAEGTLDASNILKPAMGRGLISVVGATTLKEYQKYIEKDSALERRFQKINVAEPDEETALKIIEGVKESFENYHNLNITEEAVKEAVRLSQRYITDRFLPDKAIDLLDEACSSKSMKYNIDEGEISKLKEKIAEIQKKIDAAVISQQYKKASTLKDEQKNIEEQIYKKKKKFDIPKEKRFNVTEQDVQKVLSNSTKIPVSDLSKDDIDRLKKLPKNLETKIIGQKEAIDAVVSAITRSKAGINHPSRPLGSFLFLGPTGVGKTELVKVLASEFYGDPDALIKVDMSEYSDKTGVNKLIGSRAGYVGYEEGGLLTEKVRKNPYSIILFDEIEKGDFDVYNLMLQILDEGVLTDSKGKKINFKNTIVIMTSNIGQEEFNKKAKKIGFEIMEKEEDKAIEDFEKAKENIKANLTDYFSPEFVNRIDKIVVFSPLNKKSIKKIIEINLQELASRLKEKGCELTYNSKILDFIAKEVYNPEFGARQVRRYIADTIEDKIANLLIFQKKTANINIELNKGKLEIK
ncbi:MAG: ATP-dependent Clp protease ATP-binding subunit [Candidatus Gracilibacteria bacterium]|nr:ATP-dependent Clp protease ATP-binding subunit [Candidatus Gracilibacteria bacterium]